ncbi:MAG: hypothetical protein NTW03_08455, partial [Verrucomicrobia bacterium]|nr:hypothetical protein [Verrucomicrobiota bacterium]
VVIAGALNVLGLRRVVVTGSLTEMPPVVLDYLSKAIIKGSMWARFGEVTVQAAPRRRIAGLVAVGLDRLVLPMTEAKRGPRSVSEKSDLSRSRRKEAQTWLENGPAKENQRLLTSSPTAFQTGSKTTQRLSTRHSMI